MTRACFPGSFDPPTIGHRAIVRAVLERGIERVDLVLSADPLGKPSAAPVDRRLNRLRDLLAGEPGADVVTTEDRLIVDIADGYDLLVMGADKWAQVNDPDWYGGSTTARDEAVLMLPPVVVVPRHGVVVPRGVEVLRLDPEFEAVSSTAVREGRTEWLWRRSALDHRR